MTILDRSGIDGPPAGFYLTALSAFHLAIDDEQYAPHQVPYTTRHSQYLNLTIAEKGSYTYGKDLPTIDQSIVEAAKRRLKKASM